MSDYPSQTQDKFVLRLPDGMRDRIKAAASESGRSMNGEIVAVLEEKFPAPTPQLSFGQFVQQARESKGLTIEQVAELTGIRPHHLELIEAGRRSTSFTDGAQLAGALRISLLELAEAAQKSPSARSKYSKSKQALAPPDD